ncbi:MAG TPA: hypothetical protein VKS79_07275 [Gemmataceae bacterium]|nr:hypothetical protein [Gemmataceae bacterium]
MAISNDPVPLAPPQAPPEIRSIQDNYFFPEDWTGVVGVMRKIDWLAAGILLVLAFLLALTPAHNSDLWLHLASGRALMDGSYRLGQDPFAPAGEQRAWVNHNWLLDVVTYQSYQHFGASSLVFVKAGLAVVLGLLLLQLGRLRQMGWHQVIGAGLALLTISPRFSLQPAFISYLLFALVWLFLERPIRQAVQDHVPLRFQSLWPVPVLMLLWANVDVWFVLGLVAIVATILGEVIRTRVQNAPLRLAPLGLVLIASVGACLVNPHHVHVFALPPEIRALWESPGYPFEALNLSLLQDRYYGTTLAHSVGGMTCFVLAGLSGALLILNRRSASSLRLWPLWLIFFTLAILLIRAIPFFAIVAGPLLALNWQDFAERNWSDDFRSDTAIRASFSVRVMTLLVFLALPVVAWAGWLQPQPYEPRGWTVEADPSLRLAAEQWRQWRVTSQIRSDEVCWNSSPDVAHYLSWFGNGDGAFLDSRFPVTDQQTKADYEALHTALLAPPKNDALLKALEDRKIRFLMVHNDPVLAINLYQYAQNFPEQWSIVFQNGGTTIGYWNGGNRRDNTPAPLRSPVPAWEPTAQAFQQRLASARPATLPAPKPRLPDWKSPFVDPPALVNPDRDEAFLMLRCFELERPRRAQQYQPIWKVGLAAALVAPSGIGTGSTAVVTDTALRFSLLTLEAPKSEPAYSPVLALAHQMGEAQMSSMDQAAPAWLFLAIRAARRAIQAHPEDARAWQALGNAYAMLHQNTSEQTEFKQWYDFQQLCTAQTIAAWTQAIQLNPELDKTTLALADYYRLLNQPELALPFYRRLVARQRAAGPGRGESAEQFRARISGMTESLNVLQTGVDHQRDLYEANSANLKAEDRCAQAEQLGLSQTALDTILDADVAAFGRPGLKLEMELLLRTGRAYDVRDWLTDEYESLLTELDFHWVKARMFAVLGDYQHADAEIQRMAEISIGTAASRGNLPLRVQASVQVAAVVLESMELYKSPVDVLWKLANRGRAFNNLNEMAGFLGQHADLQVLRGLLALEAGNISLARQCFLTGLAAWGSDEAVRSGSGIDFNGRRLAQHYLHMIEAAGP